MSYSQSVASENATSEEIPVKKILIRRQEMVKGKIPWTNPHRVQLWRHTVQLAFALLNIYIGVMFYLWVRFYETGGQSIQVSKPTGVEGWLPIAGLLNLKYTLATGQLPKTHIAAMLLLAAFIVVSLILKKAFCSWLCPVGTLSEALWRFGQKVLGRNILLPRWLDISLRSLKYLLLGFFVYILVITSVETIPAFMSSPYGIISDVKMLNFFRYAGMATIITVSVLLIGSLIVPNLWCRYLCPYGALMGLFSLLSPFKIRRDANACIDCEKCAKVCPSRLPVDQKLQITSAECTACMSCVDICPAKDALQLSIKPRKQTAANGDEPGIHKRWAGRKLSGALVAWLLVLIVGGTVIGAKLSGHWETVFPESMYEYFIPRAQSIGH